jgi:hypothetical protein
MSFSQITHRVATDVWGFVPNRDIKSVHLANGLFKELTQQVGAPNAVQRVAGGFLSGKVHRRKGDPMTTEQVREEIREYVIVADGGGINTDRVEDLRAALDAVLKQDRAFFGNGPFTPTLTHRLLTTSDPSDQQTGWLLAHVLFAGASKAASALRHALDTPTDNTYLLASPLLKHTDMPSPPDPDPRVVDRVNGSLALRNVQEAFETLAGYASDLEKTMFLQRTVTLGSFGLFLHLVNAVPNDDRGLVPILLSSVEQESEVLRASRDAFRRAEQRTEQAFEAGLRREFERSGQDTLKADEYVDVARTEYLHPDGTKRDKRVWRQFETDFSTGLVESDPFTAFVRALTPAAFVEIGNSSPADVAKFIGRTAGLVFPRNQGRGDRYYLPASQFIDALVTALVEPDEDPLTEHAFWSRARNRFGIVSGALGHEDTATLRAWGIVAPPAGRLAHNATGLLHEMLRMGHARQFADGVALIKPSV